MEIKKRLIDANALQFKPEPVDNIMNGVLFIRGRGVGKTVAMVSEALKCMIDNAPTVDAVEVVRCKECEFSYEGLVNLMCGRCGQKKGDLRLGGVSVAEDHFCGYGKRREKE